MALQLLQQWATAFAAERATLPAFADAVARLQAKGVQFPGAASGQSAPVFTPPPAMFPFPDENETGGQGESVGQRTSSSGSSGGEGVKAEDAAGLAKLADDLKALQEKIKLCCEMLPESPGVHQDETLADVVGFLEACQPRMVDLVEAGMQGLLGEELLMTALQLNDKLATTLEAERTGNPLPPPAAASPTAAAAASGSGAAPAPPSASASNADQTADLLGPMSDVSFQGEEEELIGRRKDRKQKLSAEAAAAAPAVTTTTAASAAVPADASAGASSNLQPSTDSTSWPPLAPPAAIAAQAPPPRQQFVVPADDPFKDLTPPTASVGPSSQPPAAGAAGAPGGAAADSCGAAEMGFTPAVATVATPATPLSELDAYETPYVAPSTHQVLAVGATDGAPTGAQEALPAALAPPAPTSLVATGATPAADPFASLVSPPSTNPEAPAGQQDSFSGLGEIPGSEVRRTNF